MKNLKGIAVSSGIVKAKAFVLKEEKINLKKELIKNVAQEIKKFDDAIKKAESQILLLKKAAIKKMGEEKAAIFDAHLTILFDPEILDQTKAIIKDDSTNASWALNFVVQKYVEMFSAIQDPYIKERVADIKDVSGRVIKILENIEILDLSTIDYEVIIVAHDLTPSETSQLNPKYVKGFLTEIGGKTSHSAIMARTMEIPAIVGIGSKIFEIKKFDELLMDGTTGEVIISPSKQQIDSFLEKAKIFEKEKQEQLMFKGKPAVSKDGWKTLVVSNIGSLNDLEGVIKNGSDGIGLFRTEFLYMDSSNWPTEEEQFEAYKKVLQTLKDKPVLIRTLDIGGDKTLPYFTFPHELNPFLGYRAIRFQLDKKEILNSQFRALLRASAFGNLYINVPMIATVDEFKQVIKNIESIKKDLAKEKIKVGKFKLGIMVEIPSTVETIDMFAKYADFFSIGTNDLIQYTFAADRMNHKVSYLYQPFHPAILRKIKKVIDESHKHKKWTAICGEMASDPYLTPIFVGMGLDEFSMSSGSTLKIKKLISKIDKKQAQLLVEKVLIAESEKEVKDLINSFLKKNNIVIV